jgi:replication-associated recombination protein RarA
MINLINWVIQSENTQLCDAVKNAILFAAEGCARKAMVILDQIIDIQEEEKQLEAINENTPDETTVIDLCRKIMAKEPGANRWKEISVMLKGIDQEAEGVRRAILGYLTSVLLNGDHKNGERVVQLMSEFMNNYYDSGKSGLIASCYMSTLI